MQKGSLWYLEKLPAVTTELCSWEALEQNKRYLPSATTVDFVSPTMLLEKKFFIKICLGWLLGFMVQSYKCCYHTTSNNQTKFC